LPINILIAEALKTSVAAAKAAEITTERMTERKKQHRDLRLGGHGEQNEGEERQR